MNRSGQAVQKLMNFYKIDAKDLLVIHDDIDLMVGKVQFKFGGGLAGHNGLKDIAEKLGTKDFARIRIGVDRPAIQSQVSDYVLSSFKKEEIEKIQDRYLDFEKIIFEFINS
ncbi:MAG TPA: aminoacyl-tRNA hydrolase, partial [Candidatus Absconditabacterales bacterium]|nr:aminoacyl-tRNA hydrolase [Candidatus Absconditabacterales bacterium]